MFNKTRKLKRLSEGLLGPIVNMILLNIHTQVWTYVEYQGGCGETFLRIKICETLKIL